MEVFARQRRTDAKVSKMDASVLPSKLLTDLSEAVRIIRSHDYIQVFSHYDADGLSAAAIIAKTLLRAGKEFRITVFPTLNDEYMEKIRKTPAECILITDLGASYIKELDAMKCDIIVLDHHATDGRAERICYANPHLYGIDGMTSGCGATMAFLFSLQMDDKNWDLVQIAMAGIAGDRQHINGLLGLNTYLLEEGRKKGLIDVMDGSLIPLGHLNSELFLCTDPYIRGISGNSDGVERLLKDSGIGPEKYYQDLGDEDKRKLSSMIAIKLTQQGVSVQTMLEVSRTRYYLPDWKMDAETFASVLNACGRLDVPGIGIGAAMGDPKCLDNAKELDIESKKQIVESILNLDRKHLTQMDHIQWFDSSASGFTGMICGVAMQFIGDPEKPTIGINCSENTAKISSRGMWGQLDRGIDLSDALKRSCESVGGNGGGHRIASGGSCDSARREEFLRNLDKIIGEQLLNHAK
jgi:single-stranded-DNA-specific exonuclease